MNILMDNSRLLKNTLIKESENRNYTRLNFISPLFGDILNIKLVHCDSRNKKQKGVFLFL